MPIRSFLFLSMLALFSCGKKNKQPVSGPGMEARPIDNLNMQVSSFSEIDSSGVIMFPLSMGETKRYSGSSYYKEMPNYTHWNIMFLNSNTNEYYLLSEKKMLIRSYDMKMGNQSELISKDSQRHIFYTITCFDLNKDKLLTEKDPDYLFISDRSGKNFKQLSPDSYTVISWQFIKASNKVVMLVKKDSDGNNGFDETDEVTSFEIDVDKDELPGQVPEEFKKKLQFLYDRDWKRIKP